MSPAFSADRKNKIISYQKFLGGMILNNVAKHKKREYFNVCRNEIQSSTSMKTCVNIISFSEANASNFVPNKRLTFLGLKSVT